ncbi:two-component system sensor histidine kinase NtrB [Leptolyngbya sp. 7M]|uniref:two-component system sensor histidine kinase NtrB n=1 Tax=Leptolyngbya sp. 7M TaxID=2812896 RepID=UPI001B8B28E2|nr:ATP-binding protein [Leptolyngbya sp. 7M]QYO66013.1 PAS domain-containing protein [Leptolyngbya sp. 7M]
MTLPVAAKRPLRQFPHVVQEPETTVELKFISELGRSLLFMIHPRKVALRVASAIRAGVDADQCVFVAELDNIGVVSCGFDRKGELETHYLEKQRFEKWFELLPPQIGYCEEDPDKFLLTSARHRLEYVSPLHINGETKGAIIAGFARKQDFTESKGSLIEAATTMAAMSVNLSAHYESAINRTITRAREEHRRFTEAVLDALPVSIYVVDRDYRIVTWNRHREIGTQGIARDEAVGRNVFQVLARYPEGKVRQEFERAFRTGKIERIEQQTIAEDGSTKHWLVSKIPMFDPETGEVSHVITVGEDVTMRVEAIHAVGRADKLAAVGRLAAGVVHEINNPLATISACAEALEQRLEEGAFAGSDAEDDLNEYLELIKNEAFRCKSITTGLLDFSRSRTGDRHPIDVSEIIRSSVNLISHQNRSNRVEIKVDAEDNLPMINADGGQIQQALIALATNAIDAMPEGGTLTFQATTNGRRVSIEVQDTGVGIAAEDLSKIFEPFFTTKEVGKGTGLGLAVCYGIITDHGGRLSVRSNPGSGTTFTISLPIVD